MGQKVNPHGLRVGVIKDWDSRWFAGKATFGDTLVEDHKIRDYLMNKRKFVNVKGESTNQLMSRAVGISKIEIERTGADKIKIYIHTAKPGMLIGPKGVEIEKIRTELAKIAPNKNISLDIIEITNPDTDAQLVADNIAMQLEGRVSFRRAMKQAIGRTMKSGAKGIKTMVSGRLGGAEIARSESYHEGTIPLQTLRADIDYGVARANTTYGVIGVKVWIYNGEVLKGEIRTQRPERPDRRRNDRAGGRGRDDRRSRRPRDARETRDAREVKKEGGND